MLARAWTPEEDEALKDAVAAGVSLQRLAVRFKRSPSSIANRAKRLGIEVKPTARLTVIERSPLSRPRKR